MEHAGIGEPSRCRKLERRMLPTDGQLYRRSEGHKMLLDEGATRDVVILGILNTPDLLNSCEGRQRSGATDDGTRRNRGTFTLSQIGASDAPHRRTALQEIRRSQDAS